MLSDFHMNIISEMAYFCVEWCVKS